MEAVKDNEGDMEKWAIECKKILTTYKFPEDVEFAWWWYYVEGFTPRQTVKDYNVYLTQNKLI